MKTKLLNALKIRENESTKVFLFFLLALVIQAGVAIGESISNSMFLVHIGYEELPIVYILTSFVMLFIYIPVYTYFTNRYGEDKFFFYFLILLIILNLVILLAIEYGKELVSQEIYNYIYYLLLLYTTIVLITVYTLLWNFIDMFFDIIDSKRVFSIFSAGTALGAIVGGTIVSTASQFFSAEIVLNIWSFFVMASLAVFVTINKKYKKIDEQEIEVEDENVVTLVFTMFKNIKSSTYVLVLSMVFFISIIIATILEFEYMNILSKDQSVESLALLFGQLFIVVNIFNLIVNFFIFNRLVIYMGVKNVLLIQPIVYILVFIYMSVEVGLSAGILGFFVVQGMLVSIDYNNQNFLYNGISKKLKYQVRTFIESLGEPITISLAGVLLLNIGTTFTIAEIALFISFLYLILALILKSLYPKSMAQNLKEDWLDFTKKGSTVLNKLSLEEQKSASSYLNDDKNTILVAKFVATYSYSKAIEILLPYLNKVSTEDFKTHKTFLVELLNSNHPDVTKVTIDWIEFQKDGLSISLEKELASKGLLSYDNAFNKLNDKNNSIASASATVVLDSQYPDHINKAIHVIEKLLKTGKDEDILEVLYILSKSRHDRYAYFAAEFLNGYSHLIKIRALETILELCNKNSNKLIESILACFINGSKKERFLSLEILNKIQDTQSLNRLFKHIALLSAYEKRQVSSIVNKIGLQSVPLLTSFASNTRLSYTSRSIATRALGNLAFEQFKVLEKDLIKQELENIYKYLYMRTIVLEEYAQTQDPYLLLLGKCLLDKKQVLLEFILENLTIGGEMESFELIKTSLRSSNSKIRANAIETIEQSTHKDIFKLLLPLLDDRTMREVIRFYKSNYTVKDYKLNEVLEHTFLSNIDLEAIVTIPLITKYDENHLNIFRERLLDKNTNKLIKDTILFELTQDKDYVNVVSKLIHLIQDKNMSGFSIFALYLMLKNSFVKDYNKETQLSNDALIYVLEGEVKYNNTTYKKGQLIGTDILFTDKELEIVCETNAQLLTIPKQNILDAIEIYPEIGIEFFKVEL